MQPQHSLILHQPTIMSKKKFEFPFTAISILLSAVLVLLHPTCSAQSTTTYDPFSQDPIIRDSIYPGIKGLKINSGDSKLNVLEYYPTGKGPHPTLILLHGYTGMAGNIDIATTLIRAGWNVVFFRYRGCWGMPGEFSFQHCVEDVVNITNYCKANAASMNVDTAQIALFGHSMGGWVALKAAAKLPFVKKVFLLSTWDIYKTVINGKAKGTLNNMYAEAEAYAELKIRSGKLLYEPVLSDSTAFKLPDDGAKLTGKKLFFLDEHNSNKYIVDSFKTYMPHTGYEVWKSDHSFTYTRVAMMRKLLSFLNE